MCPPPCGASAALTNVTIKASADGGHGEMCSGAGSLTATNCAITTAGASSAAIATDRGGGTITVTGGTMTTSGMNSPGIYSTGAITVSGANDGGETNLTYTWSATTLPSGATAPKFSINGTNAAKNTTATFSAAGNYAFTVTIADQGGLKVTSAVNVVVNQALTSIVVTPASVALGVGATQQFAAKAVDQFGSVLTTQPTFTWATTAGTITSAGLLTAPKTAATGTVTATNGSVKGTSSVTVTSQSPAPAPPPAPPPHRRQAAAAAALRSVLTGRATPPRQASTARRAIRCPQSAERGKCRRLPAPAAPRPIAPCGWESTDLVPRPWNRSGPTPTS